MLPRDFIVEYVDADGTMWVLITDQGAEAIDAFRDALASGHSHVHMTQSYREVLS